MASSASKEDASMLNQVPASHTTATITGSQTISTDERALYDRQIRLWGMEAQARMRNAHILLITLHALASEVAKNLVLAGIGSLTILDPGTISEDDLGAQYFIGEEHVGMNRAEAAAPAIQQLNPRVSVYVDTGRVQEKDTNFFKQFDVVVATELDLDSLLFINNATRICGRPFYAAATYGIYGYAFADLIKHTFVIERDKPNIKTELKKETRTRTLTGVQEKKDCETIKELVTKEEIYAPLSEVLRCQVDKNWRLRKRKNLLAILPAVRALWTFQRLHKRLPGAKKEDYGEFTKFMTECNRNLDLPEELVKSSFIVSFIENVDCELTSAAAILGGVLAQDVINALGKREQPLQNFLVFDGDAIAGPLVTLYPRDENE